MVLRAESYNLLNDPNFEVSERVEHRGPPTFGQPRRAK